MPIRPLRPCAAPGCGALVDRGRCPKHSTEPQRASYSERGYGTPWRKARALFLKEHPLCEAECKNAGRTTPATTVDHVVPHKGDPALFWDRSNWRASCTSCHSRKTARQDGGFGNQPQRAVSRSTTVSP